MTARLTRPHHRSRATRAVPAGSRRTLLTAGLVGLGLAVAGCGQQVAGTGPGAGGGDERISSPTAGEPIAVDDGTVLAGTGIVLVAGDGPQFCLGGVAESLPPQCEGPAVSGWEWDDVEHEEESGVRWTDTVRLAGTFDGDTFTLADEPGGDGSGASASPPEPDPHFPELCDDPYRGGDETSEPEPSAMEELSSILLASPGYVGHYVSDGRHDVNVIVTAETDVEDLHARARAVWPGYLCIEARDAAPEADVQAAVDAVASSDLDFLMAGGDLGVLQVQVLVADEDTVTAIHDLAAPWLTPEQIEITSALRPTTLEAGSGEG